MKDNTTKRREFLKKGSILAAGAVVLPSISCSTTSDKKTEVSDQPEELKVENKKIGVQIYSVREQLSADFEGTLGRLAEIGYTYVEGYGLGQDGKFLGKYSPEEMKGIVESTGMQLLSTHCGYFTAKEAESMLAASKEAGLTYLVIPSLPGELSKTAADFEAVAENFNQIGEVFKGSGVHFGYHNHAFEFALRDDRVPMEILLENTDPELVFFQSDLYWVTKGGYDPMKLLSTYPGRFKTFHVKDANEALEQTTVGTGIVDFEKLISARETSGLQHYFVEDERTDDPFKNLKDAFDYLNAQKWA